MYTKLPTNLVDTYSDKKITSHPACDPDHMKEQTIFIIDFYSD